MMTDNDPTERRAVAWKPPNGLLIKMAASITAAVFIIGFLMQLLGWRFTGSGEDIRTNTADIERNRMAIELNATITSTNTSAIAALVATTAAQSKDIADIRAALRSMMFMNCAIYQKTYEGAPVLGECQNLGR